MNVKKYLFLLLIPFLVVGFLKITQKSADDIIIKVYEEKINEGFKEYFDEFGTDVSSENIEYAWILEDYGIDFTIYPDLGGSKILKYWDYIGNYSKDLNCSKYIGPEYIRCITMRLKAGADSETLFEDLSNVNPSSYYEMHLMTYAVALKAPSGDFVTASQIICEKFSEFYSEEEPEELCEYVRKSNLLWLCFKNDLGFRGIAYSEPKNLEEFTCYYRAYKNFKHTKFVE